MLKYGLQHNYLVQAYEHYKIPQDPQVDAFIRGLRSNLSQPLKRNEELTVEEQKQIDELLQGQPDLYKFASNSEMILGAQDFQRLVLLVKKVQIILECTGFEEHVSKRLELLKEQKLN